MKTYGLFLLVLISFNLYAQDAYQNESKYWFYRYRLLTEFLVNGEDACGKGSGYSIPCGSAYSSVSAANGNSATDENLLNFDTCLNFGDGSSFLGYYMAVLATEHKLMQNKGAAAWQLNRVRQELYYAMKAYERLDKNVENLIASVIVNQACDLNF
jgi:hypothetical protein